MAKAKDKSKSAERMPSLRVLKDLLSQNNKAKEKTGVISGDLGQLIRTAVEKNNLHAGAFKQIAKMTRWDPVRLRAFLDHFDAYRDVLKLDDMKATDLFKDAKDADGAEKPARAKRASGKSRSRKPAKKDSEQPAPPTSPLDEDAEVGEGNGAALVH